MSGRSVNTPRPRCVLQRCKGTPRARAARFSAQALDATTRMVAEALHTLALDGR